MRLNFMSPSFFLCLLGYPELDVVEELAYDGAKTYWLLLLILLCFILDICLSLVLTDLSVSVWNLPPLSHGAVDLPGDLLP